MAASPTSLISPRHNAIVIPYRRDVHSLLPSAFPFVVPKTNKEYLKIPYGLEEVRLLNNLGITTPAPVLKKYNWAGGTPFDSQQVTAAMLTSNSRAYVLSSMGVGKTRAALYSFDFLRQEGAVKKCLVVAPLSTLSVVWENEIFENFHHLSAGILHGKKQKRLQVLSEDHDVYIINTDGIYTLVNELLVKNFDCVIVDELATFRNKSTRRWKMLRPIVQQARYAWGLTGVPTPNAPTDAYGQIRLLTPSRAAMSHKAFREKTMRQVSAFRWVPREEANDIVFEAMQPAVRFSLEDCHDLPPTTYTSREVMLSAAQKRAYESLKRHCVMQGKQGLITTANEAGLLNKLLQVGAGFAYNNEGKGEYVDAAARLKTTVEVVRECEGKVIVFACYKWAVQMLEFVLRGFGKPLVIHGQVAAGERNRRLTLFKNDPSHRILVAHPGCMSHGLNLQVASTIIWYTPTHSLDTYLQANARIARPGQTRHMTIVHLVASPVEKKVFSRLRQRKTVMGVLLEMFESRESAV